MKWLTDEKEQDKLTGVILIVLLAFSAIARVPNPTPKWVNILTVALLLLNVIFQIGIYVRTLCRKRATLVKILPNRWPDDPLTFAQNFYVDIPMSEHEKGPYPVGSFWETLNINQQLEIVSQPNGVLRVRVRYPFNVFDPSAIKRHPIMIKVSGQ